MAKCIHGAKAWGSHCKKVAMKWSSNDEVEIFGDRSTVQYWGLQSADILPWASSIMLVVTAGNPE